MQELFGFALAFRYRGAGAVDVRAGAIVVALEKHNARPDVDGLFVFSGEIVVETGNEELFDASRALGSV